jgi:CubicO group peptidase (beta-lactamase class C family)
MTKLITSTCALQLVERGKFKLEDDVRPFLPNVAAMQLLKGFDDHGAPILEDNKKPITLKYVLT